MAYSKDFRKKVLEIMALESLRVVEWLPPYSPDLNPIEHKWNQAKSLKRKLQCSIDSLFQLK